MRLHRPALAELSGKGNSALLAGLALAWALGVAPAAGAATLTFYYTIEFSGGTPPEGATPWLTATFDDSVGGPNDVRLTMSASGLVDAESVASFYFNLNPALDPIQLDFSPVGTPGSDPNSILTGVDAFAAGPDGMYDILFDFPPPPGSTAERFTAGETVVYDLTYTGPISVADFNFFAALGEGSSAFRSAAHVQRIGSNDSGSGWIGATPEPGTALLLGLGLVGLAAGRDHTARRGRRPRR